MNTVPADATAIMSMNMTKAADMNITMNTMKAVNMNITMNTMKAMNMNITINTIKAVNMGTTMNTIMSMATTAHADATGMSITTIMQMRSLQAGDLKPPGNTAVRKFYLFSKLSLKTVLSV